MLLVTRVLMSVAILAIQTTCHFSYPVIPTNSSLSTAFPNFPTDLSTSTQCPTRTEWCTMTSFQNCIPSEEHREKRRGTYPEQQPPICSTITIDDGWPFSSMSEKLVTTTVYDTERESQTVFSNLTFFNSPSTITKTIYQNVTEYSTTIRETTLTITSVEPAELYTLTTTITELLAPVTITESKTLLSSALQSSTTTSTQTIISQTTLSLTSVEPAKLYTKTTTITESEIILSNAWQRSTEISTQTIVSLPQPTSSSSTLGTGSTASSNAAPSTQSSASASITEPSVVGPVSVSRSVSQSTISNSPSSLEFSTLPSHSSSSPSRTKSRLTPSSPATVTRQTSGSSEPSIATTTTTTITSFETILSTGIILCSSRVINPTYTPSAELPQDFTWGCPPSTICDPPKIDCNFELGLPADSYVCSPSECIPVPPLPPVQYWGPPVVSDESPESNGSLHFVTNPQYFNLNTLDFGLNYGIFTEIYTFVISEPATAIEKRQAEETVPGQCYDECNDCALEAEQSGKTPALCTIGSAFEVTLGYCHSCIDLHQTSDSASYAQKVQPQFAQFLDYCSDLQEAATTSTIPSQSSTAQPAADDTTSLTQSPTPLTSSISSISTPVLSVQSGGMSHVTSNAQSSSLSQSGTISRSSSLVFSSKTASVSSAHRSSSIATSMSTELTVDGIGTSKSTSYRRSSTNTLNSTYRTTESARPSKASAAGFQRPSMKVMIIMLTCMALAGIVGFW